MRIIFILIFLSFINTTTSQSEGYNLKKLVELEEPWGSTFINNNEIIVICLIKVGLCQKLTFVNYH